jgi:hypothetical protein
VIRRGPSAVGPASTPDGERSRLRVGDLPPLPRRRRRQMVLLAVGLVAAGAVFAGYGFSAADSRTEVLAMRRDVAYGTPLSAADLTVTRVTPLGAVPTVPASMEAQVIGKAAAVDLRQGTLLAMSELTSAVSPLPGQEVVPVAVKESQIPARGLRPGDHLLVIATPGAQGQDTGSSATPPLSQDVPAAVDRVSGPDPDGTVTVDVIVSSQWGPAIARQSSIGRIGFVLTSRES